MTLATQGQRIAGAVLDPDEAQATFRAVLDALARPGIVGWLPEAPVRRMPTVLLPILALADLGTPVCVLEDETGCWAEVLTTVTSAPAVPLPQARLVASLRAMRPDELAAVARGTADAPEDGALVTIPVSGPGEHSERRSGSGVAGGGRARYGSGSGVGGRACACHGSGSGVGGGLRVSGPGVDGHLRISPRDLDPAVLAVRAAAVAGFPAGVDLLLVGPDGHLLGLPRSTRIEEDG